MSFVDNVRLMKMPKNDREWSAFMRELDLATNREWYFEVAAGNVAGYYAVQKFGFNTAVGTTQETIWDAGGAWVAPTAARVHNIVSTSTDDDLAGAGAQKIRIYGVTSWTDSSEVYEDIEMDGTTNVPTTNSFVCIHRMLVIQQGASASGPNVGVITATAVTDATVTAQMNAQEGQTQMAIYGIGDKQTIFVTGFYGDAARNSSSVGVTLQLEYNDAVVTDETDGSFLTKHTIGGTQTGGLPLQHMYQPPNRFVGPGILKLSAEATASGTEVAGGFAMVVAGPAVAEA